MEKNIIMDSIVPVRKEPNEQSEMVTQLLFGELYIVLSEKNGWSNIKGDFDNYEGFIDNKFIFQLSPAALREFEIADKIITLSPVNELLELNSNTLFFIPSGCVIRRPEKGNVFSIGKKEFKYVNGENKPFIKENRDFVISMAEKYINSPYLWGGRTHFGIDCSGLAQMVYKIAGYSLFRDAHQQATQGSEVNKPEDSVPGDLLFFEKNKNKISHVGIYLGAGDIIHGSGRVRKDKVDKNGILTEKDNDYSHYLTIIRRIIV